MNDDFQDSLPQAAAERLEWATSTTSPAPDGVDPQAAALREAWVAWGRLLETAESPLEPLLVRLEAPRPRLPRWVPLGAGMAAALLGIVAVTAWYALKRDRATNAHALPETIASAVREASKPPVATSDTSRSVPVARPKAVAASDAAEPGWNDTVDDEIVQVSQRLVTLQQGWHAGADGFASVRSRLERMHSEIEAADSGRPSVAPDKKADPARPEKTSPSGSLNKGSGSSAPIPSVCQSRTRRDART